MEPNTVTVRDLRNNGGVILRRVRDGETLVVTLDGEPVAELRPIGSQGLSASETIRRAKNMPVVDYAQLRADIDAIFDPRLFPDE